MGFFSTFVSVAKIVVGIREEPDWKTRSWYIRKYPNTLKAVEWSKIARESQDHPLNKHLSSNDQSETPRPATPDALGERPLALLKGSPKALGWEVDEDEEEAAWCMLMADAIETSVYEKTTAADIKEALRVEAAAAAQKEYYRNYLEQWDEQRTKLVWKVNVSLNGDHSWTLVPRKGSSSPALNETAFDSNGVLSVVPAKSSSSSSSKATRERSFSDAGVQAPVDGHTPIGAQEPLSEIPPLLDVGVDISRPPTPALSIASQSSKIPRLASLRRASVASLTDAALRQTPLSQPPSTTVERPALVSLVSAPVVPARALERRPSVSVPVVGAPPSSLAHRSSSPAPSMRSVTARLLHRRQSGQSLKTEGTQPSKLSMSPSKQPSLLSRSRSQSQAHNHHHDHNHGSPPKLTKRASERVKSAMKAMGGSYEAAELFKGFM